MILVSHHKIYAPISSLIITYLGGYSADYNYTDEERRFFVSAGPFQPLLSSFPRNDVLAAAKDTCKFVGNWYKEYPMIEYSIIKDAAFCFVCRLFHQGAILIYVYCSFIRIHCLDTDIGPGDHKKHRAWIAVGVNSWSKMKGQGRKKKG